VALKRVLIIPAAGLGSRLQSSVPKVLHPLAGRPLLDYLLDLYRPVVDRIILVLHPSFADEVRHYCGATALDLDVVVQPVANGMLPALLVPYPLIATYAPAQVWATWCDQVAVHPRTVQHLADIAEENDVAFVFPTVVRNMPYIHFDRDEAGVITRVLEQREGDRLPPRGESDAGLFCFSRTAYLDHLATYAAAAPCGAGTGEANFLPFIPWLAQRETVVTFPVVDEMEAIGINTADDLRRVEGYLRERQQDPVGRHSRV
jgi:bifunctional N-acetylglucosamine-1-phosphate-uridyltransferase/glucosamine-1-phosphate-acetyltransferase GlmU-like protein